jgi:hypothetical protein
LGLLQQQKASATHALPEIVLKGEALLAMFANQQMVLEFS